MDSSLRRSARIGIKTLTKKDVVKSNGGAIAEKVVKSKYFGEKAKDTAVKREVEVDQEQQGGVKETVKRELEDQSTGNRRKIVKREEVEIETKIGEPVKQPPKNFELIYNEVKAMRSKITTPVDTMGSAFLPTKTSGLRDGPVFRYQLLVCLMLSAQTKDEVNAQVMQILQDTGVSKGFKDGLCVDFILATSEQELDKLIFKVGFHSRKAKFIKQTTEILRRDYNDDVPKTIEELLAFPGVGPKMGYLVLQAAWDITLGLGVDVHIFRLANMWNWVPKAKNPTPENTRLELEKWLPRELWKEFNPIIVGFGQSICQPRGRRCDLCTLPKYGRLCPNVDRALLKKMQTAGGDLDKMPQRKMRGDLSGIMKVTDIEDLA